MWIVAYALRHRYTVGVFAALILLAGASGARRMSTDVLPFVDIPSVTLVWTYAGLNAPEMAAKLTSFSEASILNNADDVREVRSETTNGVAIVRVDFQPYVNIDLAIAQVAAVSQTILRRMPPGTNPPLIVRYTPSSTPIMQLVLASDTLNEAQLYDFARLQMRSQLQSIPGLRLTLPYGGAERRVMVDLSPEALQAHRLTPADVSRAIAEQSLTLPSGVIREGSRELQISLNASPEAVADFEMIPVRSAAGRVTLLRDVAVVRDGGSVPTNIARLDGQNAVIVSVLKLGGASTVDIANQIKARLPEIAASAPPGVTIAPVFDQSTFVTSAVAAVAKEALIVACLVAAAVFVFLGSWRSTLIVLTSIPLALLASIVVLWASGATFNLMTLGGLALAIGILVDNALVEIENINRNLDRGMPIEEAVLNSARQVVFPEFVSTLCICIVFLPVFLLTGVSAFVFGPLALAVVAAMTTSFLLSRTLVPTLAAMLLGRKERLGRLQAFVDRADWWLDRLRDRHRAFLAKSFARPLGVVAAFGALLAVSAVALPTLGRELFPATDAGLMRIYVRALPGSRLEDTAGRFAELQSVIRGVIPSSELAFVAENIGAPEPINLAWVESAVSGSFDGEMLVQLKPGHAPTDAYVVAIRAAVRKQFPDMQIYFAPADATSRTLASDAPTAIDVRVVGRDPMNRVIAEQLKQRLQEIPGATDVLIRQAKGLPDYRVEIDRIRAARAGLTEQEAASAILAALGTGATVAPSFWADSVSGSSYAVQVSAPPPSLRSSDDLLNLYVSRTADGEPVTLRSVATLTPRTSPPSVSRVTLAPAINVLANVEGRDLGAVRDDLQSVIDDLTPQLKPTNRIEVRGPAEAMRTAYSELAGGLLFAIVLVFLILAINFQSWLLPLVALSGLPFALGGAVLLLAATATPLSVPALMGMIMVVGVSTANSVLVVSFARDQLAGGSAAQEAALDAAATRLRPVLMTALAMVLGLVPMALGLGEGGEQNAPLGRAAIGGLLTATLATLVIVPWVFAKVAGRNGTRAQAPTPSGVLV